MQKETHIFSNSLPIASRLNGAHVTDSREAIGRLSEGTQASLRKETHILSNSLPIASRLNGAHVTGSREGRE